MQMWNKTLSNRAVVWFIPLADKRGVCR